MTAEPAVRADRSDRVVLAAMFTAVALWASAFVAIRDALHWFSPGAPARGLLAVAYLGVFPAAVAFVAWSYALARASVSGTTTALYLVPWLTIVIGVVWLGEWPNALGFVGGAIALAGAVVVTRERLRRSPAPADESPAA